MIYPYPFLHCSGNAMKTTYLTASKQPGIKIWKIISKNLHLDNSYNITLVLIKHQYIQSLHSFPYFIDGVAFGAFTRMNPFSTFQFAIKT